MRAYVGITDGDWYSFLRARPDLSEVNFWRPGRTAFRALSTGEPFLFKTHYPHNRLVGGGFFSGFERLHLSEAWRFLGPANGCESIDQMRARIAYYRRASVRPEEDPQIGCVLLRDVLFSAESETLPAPPDFAPSVVSGKGYPLRMGQESFVEQALQRLLVVQEPLGATVPGPVFGGDRLVRHRLGQQAFKALVLGAYERRCAITGAKMWPVLEAAHIRPVSRAGENRLDNGLLLRSDVHIMYDQGYLGVDRHHRLQVSPRIRSQFQNGAEFYARTGSHISVPARRVDQPGAEFLEWHMDTVFLAS